MEQPKSAGLGTASNPDALSVIVQGVRSLTQEHIELTRRLAGIMERGGIKEIEPPSDSAEVVSTPDQAKWILNDARSNLQFSLNQFNNLLDRLESELT